VCRGDLSTLQGIRLYCYNAGSGLGNGALLVSCATEFNQQEGYYCGGGGHNTYGPYQIVGCKSSGDGEGGTYGAVRADGRVVVSLTDFNVSGGSGNPAYGLVTSKNSGSNAVPDLVTINGGTWQAGTAFISDGGPATLLVKAGGTYGVIGAINGTSGTTTFTAV
jgi:hypothetical protein